MWPDGLLEGIGEEGRKEGEKEKRREGGKEGRRDRKLYLRWSRRRCSNDSAHFLACSSESGTSDLSQLNFSESRRELSVCLLRKKRILSLRSRALHNGGINEQREKK